MGTQETVIKSEGFTTEDWYKDLVKAHTTELPRGAITVKQFEEDTGLSELTARRVLVEKMENDPRFHGRKMTTGGCKRWVFWSEEK